MTSPNGSVDGSQTPNGSCTTGSNDGDLNPSIAAIPSVSPSTSQASILRSASSPGSHLKFVLPDSVAMSSQVFITASDPSASSGTVSPRIPNFRGSSGTLHRKSWQASSNHHAVLRRTISDARVSSIRRPWQSTKTSGDIEKPWLQHVDPAHRWAKVVFWVLFVLGITGAGALCYFGYASIPSLGDTCLVMHDDFSNGISSEFWSHEVRLDGFGQFEWATESGNNSFVEDNTLYIVPTLTSDIIGQAAVTDGYTLNLTTDGICTSSNVSQCAAVSNISTGSIINPVRSARLITKNKASLRYGKVEVEARMPTGDWLWPAIWMLPVHDVYGDWPLSGEIDIAESRGNGVNYGADGFDWMSSTLHWGPLPSMDSYWRTSSKAHDKVNGYNTKFHKFTLEWDDKYLMTYIDSKINTVYEMRFDKSFWGRGSFPGYFQNGTDLQKVVNPWAKSENNAAPFDQEFYLILNVAVGGQNGYFPDNVGNKPWDSSARTAMADFWASRDKWYPTWPSDPTKRGMAVKSVKMWKKC